VRWVWLLPLCQMRGAILEAQFFLKCEGSAISFLFCPTLFIFQSPSCFEAVFLKWAKKAGWWVLSLIRFVMGSVLKPTKGNPGLYGRSEGPLARFGCQPAFVSYVTKQLLETERRTHQLKFLLLYLLLIHFKHLKVLFRGI
jgi:hypothetical protein